MNLIYLFQEYEPTGYLDHLPSAVVSKLYSLPYQEDYSRFNKNNPLIRKLNMISDKNYDLIIKDFLPLIKKNWDDSIDKHFIDIILNQKLHIPIYVCVFEEICKILPHKVLILEKMFSKEKTYNQCKNLGFFYGTWISKFKKCSDWIKLHNLINKDLTVVISFMISSNSYLNNSDEYKELLQCLKNKMNDSSISIQDKIFVYDLYDLA